MKKVYIIIVNWNNPKDTMECIKHVKRLKYPDFSVIVVDNGSTDDSVKIIQGSFPDIQLIETKRNIGYPAACNIGIDHGLKEGAHYIFLLNNDVIVDEEALNELVKVMEKNRSIGIAGPKVYFYHDKSRIFSAGGRLSMLTGQNWAVGQGEIDTPKYNTIREVDYVSGCAFLIKRELLDDIGYMDPQYFMYYDEIDLCVRARKKGYKVVYVPRAKVWHKVSATAYKVGGLKEYYVTRNRFLIQKKFLKRLEYAVFLTWFFSIWLPFRMGELLFIRRSLSLGASFVRGIADGLRIRHQNG